MASRVSTMRALGYVLVFGLCTWCFYRILEGALLGYERSPWLLALGDVIFVTLGLYTWVMVLAEGHSLEAYGMRRISAGRLFLTPAHGRRRRRRVFPGILPGPLDVSDQADTRYADFRPRSPRWARPSPRRCCSAVSSKAR